jgi:hypothetical protein
MRALFPHEEGLGILIGNIITGNRRTHLVEYIYNVAF